MRISFCAQVSAAAQSFGAPTWTCVCRVHRASCTRRPPRATHVRGRTLAHVNEFTEWLRANGVCLKQVNPWRIHPMCGSWQPSPASRCWPSSLSAPRSLSGSWCTDASPTSGLYVVRLSKDPVLTCDRTEGVSYPKSQKTS